MNKIILFFICFISFTSCSQNKTHTEKPIIASSHSSAVESHTMVKTDSTTTSEIYLAEKSALKSSNTTAKEAITNPPNGSQIQKLQSQWVLKDTLDYNLDKREPEQKTSKNN